jgi:hypothetical protein
MGVGFHQRCLSARIAASNIFVLPFRFLVAPTLKRAKEQDRGRSSRARGLSLDRAYRLSGDDVRNARPAMVSRISQAASANLQLTISAGFCPGSASARKAATRQRTEQKRRPERVALSGLPRTHLRPLLAAARAAPLVAAYLARRAIAAGLAQGAAWFRGLGWAARRSS